jgi:hypothetical protein
MNRLDDLTTAVPLPRQGRASQGHKTDEGADGRAWQREMERVQAEGWFKRQDPAGADHGTRAPDASDRPRTARVEQPGPRTGTTRTGPVCIAKNAAFTNSAPESEAPTITTPARPQVSVAMPCGLALQPTRVPTSTPPRADASALAHQIEQLVGHRTVWTASPIERGAVHGLPDSDPHVQGPTSGSAAEEASIPGHSSDAAERPPVRVHVQWGDQTASVWVGLDQSAKLHAAAVLDLISRWIEDSGFELQSLVCNGNPWQRPTSRLSPLPAFTPVDEPTTGAPGDAAPPDQPADTDCQRLIPYLENRQ